MTVWLMQRIIDAIEVIVNALRNAEREAAFYFHFSFPLEEQANQDERHDGTLDLMTPATCHQIALTVKVNEEAKAQAERL